MIAINPQIIAEEFKKIWITPISVHCSAGITDKQIQETILQLPDNLHDQPFTVKRYGTKFTYNSEFIDTTMLMKTRGIDLINNK